MLLFSHPRRAVIGVGFAIQSQGLLINTSTPGTTPTILSAISMTAGDMLILGSGTCRNTGGSAMALSGTWNGEALTENVALLHVGGRVTSHFQTLVAASSGSFTPIITCSASAAAMGSYFWVVRGQSGSPVKQTTSASQTSAVGGPVTVNAIAPLVGSLIFATAFGRYTTAGVTTMTPNSPLTADNNFATGTGNNLDGAFGAGHLTAPSTSDIAMTFTPDVSCNITSALIEVQ